MMKLRALSALLLSAVMLPLTGCIAGFDYTRGPYVPSVFLDYNIVVSKTTFTPQLLIYPANGSGSGNPSILNYGTGSVVITAIATDRNGNLYAGFYDTSANLALVAVFAPGGSQTLLRAFSNSAMTAAVSDLAVDPSGNVYTVDFNGNLFKFGPTASGVATPLLALSGFNTGSGIATDASGNLYLSVYEICPCSLVVGFNSIYVYNAGFTTTTPSRIITPPVLEYVDGLAVDGSGNIYASGELISGTGAGRIDVYAAGATGSATPTRTITGSATTLAGTVASLSVSYNTIALDSSGTIYTRSIDYVGSGTTLFSNILEFSSTANGNVAPTNTITTNLTTANNVDIAVY